MLLRRAFVLVQLLLLLFVSSFMDSNDVCGKDDNITEHIVTIRGNVQTIDLSNQKAFIPVGYALVFQRLDCKKCLFVTTTDENGNYSIRVGKGKYRLLSDVGYKVGKSELAPGQADYVNATNVLQDNVFDIKLVRKPHPLDTRVPPEQRP